MTHPHSPPFKVWFWREVIRVIVHLFYRLTVIGEEKVPDSGPVLFVSNHVSYADPVLLSAATQKQVRFLMWRPIYNWWPMAWFFRLMRMIPISATDSPRQMARSLQDARQALDQGERIGLFPEGEISRDGQLKEFRKGLEFLTKNSRVPIVPVNIDGMWGSIFSYERGRAFWKWPRRIPYPVTVHFGAPLPPETPSEVVREAVLSLVTNPKSGAY